MSTAGFRMGDKVVIAAKGPFFAYIDGRRGSVAGLNNGLIEVRMPGKALGDDGPTPLLTFFVPPDQLALSV